MALTPQQQKEWDAKKKAADEHRAALGAVAGQKRQKQQDDMQLAEEDKKANKEEARAEAHEAWDIAHKKATEMTKPNFMQGYEMCMRNLLEVASEIANALNAYLHAEWGYPRQPELALVKVGLAVGLATAGVVGKVVSTPFQAAYHAGDLAWRGSEKLDEIKEAVAETADSVYKNTGAKWLHEKVVGQSLEVSNEMMKQVTCDDGNLELGSVSTLCSGATPATQEAVGRVILSTQEAFLTHHGYEKNPADGNKWTDMKTTPLTVLTQAKLDELKQDDKQNLATYARSLGVQVVDKAVDYSDEPSSGMRPSR